MRCSIVFKYKIPQAVKDHAAFIHLYASQYMGAVADDCRGSCIYAAAGKSPEEFRRIIFAQPAKLMGMDADQNTIGL